MDEYIIEKQQYSFWDKFLLGLKTIKEGFQILFKHPVFFIPIIIGIVLLIGFFVIAVSFLRYVDYEPVETPGCSGTKWRLII